MAIFELRTYSIQVGHMPKVIELYKDEGWPVFQKHPPKLVSYFVGDVGALHKLVHLWKFDDEADRRAFWSGVFADPAFAAFAAKVRPSFVTQENQLMLAAPWGPQL